MKQQKIKGYLSGFVMHFKVQYHESLHLTHTHKKNVVDFLEAWKCISKCFRYQNC